MLVVLGLGSNLGDSRRIILEAAKALEEILRDCKMAKLYETEPLYVKDQANFINTALSGFFDDPQAPEISSRKLLSLIHNIETRFGRDRSRERRWGERNLDIDILLFGDFIIKESDLVIPHPLLRERRFALEPLLELLPEAREPESGLSYREICYALPEQRVKKIMN